MANTDAIEDLARQPWTVAMVLAWMMWRTPDAVLLHSESSVFQVQDDELAQAGEGNRPRMTAVKAVAELWSKLRDGAIKVTALDTQGNSVEVTSQEFFHLDEPDLESHDVLTRTFKGDSFRSSRDSSIRLFQRTIYKQPRLSALKVLEIWKPDTHDPLTASKADAAPIHRKRTGLSDPNRRPPAATGGEVMLALPTDRAPTLTEAVTWLVTGNALTDEAVADGRERARRSHDERWGFDGGHGELEVLADDLRAIQTGAPPDVSEWPPHRRKSQRAEIRKRRKQIDKGLQSRGKTIETALRELEDAIRERDDDEARYLAVYDILFEHCREGKLTLRGWPVPGDAASSRGARETIPREYFDDPVAPLMAAGYWGPITSALMPRTGQESIDVLLSDRPTRPVYLGVVIDRADVIRLQQSIRALSGASTPADAATSRQNVPLPSPDVAAWRPEWLSLAGAIAWVTTRDRPFTHLVDHTPDNDRDGMTLSVCIHHAQEVRLAGRLIMNPSAAWHAIRRKIAEEKIHAEGKPRLPTEDAPSDSAQIPSGDAGDLEIRSGGAGFGRKDALVPRSRQGRHWYDVRLRAADVFREFGEVGTLRNVAVAPTAAAVNKCRQWLAQQMRTSPDRRPKPKRHYYQEACEKFPAIGQRTNVKPSRGFEKAWSGAMDDTGSHGVWGRAGAPQKSPR